MIICGGDFNFVDPSEGRFDIGSGLPVYADPWHQETFTSLIPFLAEVHQPTPTRQETRNGYVVSLSRIDRFYVSANAMDLHDVLPSASVADNMSAPLPASDHAPILVELRIPRATPPECTRVPAWIAAHPMYEQLLAEALAVSTMSPDPYEQLLDF